MAKARDDHCASDVRPGSAANGHVACAKVCGPGSTAHDRSSSKPAFQYASLRFGLGIPLENHRVDRPIEGDQENLIVMIGHDCKSNRM